MGEKPKSKIKMKKCPFCGSRNVKPQEYEDYECEQGWGWTSTWWAIKCLKCGAKGPYTKDQGTKKEAIELWNKRSQI